jgi:phenylalanyl-tRNA synthetase beta chain
MKFSATYLKKFLDPAPETEEITELLTFCGLEVEEVQEWHSVPGGLKNFVTARILEVWPHPQADRLRCTLVDAGLEQPLKVICGAPNVAAGQSVILALEGAVVHLPGKEPFTIKKTKIRGEISEGMICAEDEIGIGPGHEGIWVLDDTPAPGTPAAEYFKVHSDTILTVNITPNRPDATSYLGLARDLCAVLNARNRPTRLVREFLEKKALQEGPCPIPFEILDPEGCKAYAGILVEGLQVGPSPDWLRTLLESCGHKSINNAVDIANLVMLETGQPLHFFDADLLEGQLEIRRAKAGEKMLFLDGVERELRSDDLVIADLAGAHCLAGIMGGRRSAVSENTKRIFIEAAWFHPGSIRRSARHHKLHTDASYRFERNTDPQAIMPALMRAAYLLEKWADGKTTSPYTLHKVHFSLPSIQFSLQKLNHFLGTALTEAVVESILRDLEFEVTTHSNGHFSVTPPSFKPDVQRFEDVAEEVIRIAGFHLLEEKKEMCFSPGVQNSASPFKRRRRLAQKLVDLGLQEVISYPMVNPEYAVAQDARIQLANPISNEMAWMRASMVESMLPVAAHNLRRQQTDVRFFEMGKIFKWIENEPEERDMLGLLVTGRRFPESWNNPPIPADLFYLKGIVALISREITWKSAASDNFFSEKFVMLDVSGQEVGLAGSINGHLLKKLDIRQPVYFAEIRLEHLQLPEFGPRQFAAPPRYPEVRRDLAFLLSKDIPYGRVEDEIKKAAGPLLRRMILFDVYEGKNLPEGTCSLAIGLFFRHDERTLTDEEVQTAINRIIQRLETSLNAVLRS